MTENLIDTYYDVIMNESNPGSNMTKFYCSLFDQKFDIKLLKMFNKFIKLYGRETVFGAVVDMFGIEEINFSNIFPLVRHFCIKKLELKNSKNVSNDLSSCVDDIANRINNRNNLVIEDFMNE